MLQKEKLKKAGFVIGCVTVGLLLLAVIVGVLNATVGDGTWVPGWASYRYDDSNYEVGEGTLPFPDVTAIEVDWIDGEVEIVACRDTFPSVTELADEELTEKSQLHWKISEDGKILTIKYRASSFILGTGATNKHKKLILRIPTSCFDSLESLAVNGVSASVSIDGVTAKVLTVSTSSGEIAVKNGSFDSASLSAQSGDVTLAENAIGTLTVATHSGEVEAALPTIPDSLAVSTRSGKVYLSLPENPSYRMTYSTDSGKRVTAFEEKTDGNTFVAGDGSHILHVATKSGNLTVSPISSGQSD